MYCDQRSQYIRQKVTVHKGAETIQGRKLFKGGNYMRKYGIYSYLNSRIEEFDFRCLGHVITWQSNKPSINDGSANY